MSPSDSPRLSVAEVMTTSVVSVTPSTPLREAARLLTQYGLSALPVIGADGTLVGVVSEADLVLDPLAPFGAVPTAPGAVHHRSVVGEAMTSPVATIAPSARLSEAARIMAGEAVRRLFVVDGTGAAVGVVSRADLLRALLRPDAEIRQVVMAGMRQAGLLPGGDWVRVTVVEGVVTLSGRALSRSHTAALTAAAAAVDGVLSVENRLEVEEGGATDARGPRPVPELGGPHRRVGAVMTTDVVTATLATPVRELARLLRQRAVSAVPVVDSEGRPVGVVSEADVLVKEAELGARRTGAWVEAHPTSRERAKVAALDAAALMTSPVLTVAAEATLAAAARRMEAEGVRRLFVVDGAGRLSGVVSRRDLLRAYDTDDGEIHTRVLDAIAPRGIWTDLAGVVVGVQDGVVTLSGRVPYRSDAVALTGLASAVEGIVGLRDELTCAIDDIAGPAAT